jgi:hypothetical protein
MKIREYIEKNLGAYVSDMQIYAADYLERHGEIFLLNFGIDNAIDKAAEMLCTFLDDDNWARTYDGWS